MPVGTTLRHGPAGTIKYQMTLPDTEAHKEDQYQLLSTIGVGAYGKAILAIQKGIHEDSSEDAKHVVIKQILLRDEDEAARQEALKEAQLLSQFDHVNIIHYYDSFFVGQTLNIVMEYASEGTLADVIARRAAEKKPFSEDDIMLWFVQVVLALYHVHSKNILFRDLKSQNIFISKGNILKLGDFGIARVLNTDTELASTCIGTPYYLSPEVCEDKPYNRKSDVWALGCLLYELCMLKRAFNGQSLPALVVQILRGRYPPVPTRYSSPLRGLVEAMLQLNPKARPSVETLLRNSYVRQHVERYARHVMQLSPAAVPLPGMPQSAPSAPRLSPAPSLEEPRSVGSSSSRVRQSAGKLPPRPARAPAGISSKQNSGPATPVKPGTPPRAPSPNTGNSIMDAPGQLMAPAAGASDASSAAVPTCGGTDTSAAGIPAAAGGGSCSTQAAQVAGVAGVSPAGASPVRSPQVGCSPMANRAGRRFGQGQPGAGTWMRQQCAALAELEGALALQGVGHRARGQQGALPGDGAGAGADEDTSAPCDDRPAMSPRAELAAAGDQQDVQGGPSGVAGAGGLEKPALGRVAMASMAREQLQAARDAELQVARQAVIQERERKAKAVARRSQVVDKAQRQRTAEREQEVARARLEARAKEAENAARHAQRAAELKGKQERKHQLQEQLLAHMAAHQHQIRAVKARVTRGQLEALGAQFAARQKGSVAGVTEAQTGDIGPRVLLVDAPAPIVRSGSSSHQGGGKLGSGHDSPAGGGRGKGRAGALQAASPQGRQSSKEHEAQDKQEPPWRAARKAAGAAAVKDVPVEVYLPYARSPEPARPPSQPHRQAGPAGLPPSPQQQHSRAVTPPSSKLQRQVSAVPAGSPAAIVAVSNVQEVKGQQGGKLRDVKQETPWESSELLGLLSEIQAVLLGSSDEEEEGEGGRKGGGSSGEEDEPSYMGALPSRQMQPLLQAVPQQHGTNQQQVQQLRTALEEELDLQSFQAAYKHVRALQQQDPQPAAGKNVGEEVLATKPHLARQFMRLITLEDKALV